LITGELFRPAADSHSPPIKRLKSAYVDASCVAICWLLWLIRE
jgi:hypothetical protein